MTLDRHVAKELLRHYSSEAVARVLQEIISMGKWMKGYGRLLVREPVKIVER